MKKNIRLKVRRLAFKYRLLLLSGILCLSFSKAIDGQEIQHIIEKEVTLSDDGRIKINGPRSVRITGSGTIYTRQIGDHYFVSRRSSSPYIYKIDKKLKINTWNKQAVKQVSTVAFTCETPAQERLLKEALSINLDENVAGIVEIDCELNINKFQVENSWFGSENNHIILDNGAVISITYLSISTTLFIPIESQVSIESEENDIILEQHEGEVEILMIGGSLTADALGDFKGYVKFAEVNVGQIWKANLELQNTTLNAKSINQLKLKSAISKLQINNINILEVSKSVNDQFRITAIKYIKVKNSVFSNYNLATCNESLEMTLKSGDVNVQNLGPSLKFAFIKNQNAKTQIDLNNLENYSLLLGSFDQSKYDLPEGLVLTTSEGQARSYEFGLEPEKAKIQIDCKLCEVVLSNLSQ